MEVAHSDLVLEVEPVPAAVLALYSPVVALVWQLTKVVLLPSSPGYLEFPAT